MKENNRLLYANWDGTYHWNLSIKNQTDQQ
jgi:hypothetical protein